MGKCCTMAACSESDNPPMSSLCVGQNFICCLEGKDSRCTGNNNNNLQPKKAVSHRRRRELRESSNHRGNWYATHELKGNGVQCVLVRNTNTHCGIHHTQHTIRKVEQVGKMLQPLKIRARIIFWIGYVSVNTALIFLIRKSIFWDDKKAFDACIKPDKQDLCSEGDNIKNI